MKIRTLAVPTAQPLNRKSMTEIVRPRSDTPVRRFSTCFLEKLLQGVSSTTDGQHLAVHSDEEAFVGSCECTSERLSFQKVSVHFSCE